MPRRSMKGRPSAEAIEAAAEERIRLLRSTNEDEGNPDESMDEGLIHLEFRAGALWAWGWMVDKGWKPPG